jgi:serine/threonine-protein kinase
MPQAPSTIGRYEIVREIGHGAMGVVYEAWDPVLGRSIALKVIQTSLTGEEGETFEKRFRAEAQIAARLQHPGIVVVHDFDHDEATGALYIALELLRGRTLADIGDAGPLEWRTALPLVAQVARALHHAHLQGVVHRDIKPANVVVLPSGQTKVMDFGIAKLESARARLTTTGEFLGTPLYSAPEQAQNEEVDARADIFSLASVAYTLLTGRAAFDAPTMPAIVHRIVYADPVPPSSLVAGLPADVEHVLLRAMAKEPEGRHPTAEAFAEDLEDLLAGRPPRHTSEEEMVVVEEPESPLAVLLADVASPPPEPLPTSPPATLGQDVSAPAPAPATPARGAPPPAPARGRWPRRALGTGLIALITLGLGYVGFKALGFWRPHPLGSTGSDITPRAAPSLVPPGSGVTSPETPSPSALSSPQPTGPPGRLRIVFDHPLRSGILRVYVDDQEVAEERLSGQKRSKALVFKVHEGSFRDEYEVSPGAHVVRLEVRWDDSLKVERIVGHFRPDTTRTLEASLGRLRKDLSLEWK